MKLLSKEVNDQLNKVRYLITHSAFLEAEKILQSINMSFLTDQENQTYQFLSVKLLNGTGRYNRCINLCNDILEKRKYQKISLHQLEIVSELSKALMSSHHYDESLKKVELAENYLSKLTDLTPQDFKRYEASIFIIKGSIYTKKGRSEDAIDLLVHGISLYVELHDDLGLIQSYFQLGDVYFYLRDFDKVFYYLDNALALLEQNNYPLEKSKVLGLLGSANTAVGQYKKSLHYGQESMKIATEIGNDKQRFVSYNIIANVYTLFGELDKALEFRQQALDLALKSGNVQDLATTYHNLSFSYRYKGDLVEAINLLEKGLKLDREIKNNLNVANSLYELITACMDLKNKGQALEYLQELENININEKKPFINQAYQLALAYTLKGSQRPKDQFKALNIFEQVTSTDMIDFELYMFALLNYCEILFLEYQIANQDLVLEDIERVLELLYTSARNNNSYLILVQTYWLQSKYALLRLDDLKAKEMLAQAQLLAEEKKLTLLATVLEKENSLMTEQITKRQQYLKEHITLPERLELTQIQHLISSMIQKRSDYDNDLLILKQTEILHEELQRRQENFIWMTNHEIRTPLTIISGFIDFLQENMDKIDREKRNRIMKLIKRNLQRLKKLSDQISLLGQLNRETLRLSKSTIDVKKFVSEAMTPYKILHGDQFQLKNIKTDSSITIEGDKDLLSDVLGNIYDNAIKHTHPIHREIKTELLVLKDTIQIKITDNGSGISPKDQERIFLQFISIPTEYSAVGTGLGLYIAQNTVKLHGGLITVTSKGLGSGSTFTISLPISN